MKFTMLQWMPAALALAAALQGAQGAPPALCRVEVRDAESGWPVPLVELRTTNHQRFVSDNAGLIALDAPEMMGVETWFDVIGHGYGVARDGFGYAGVRLTPQPGVTLAVEVRRELPARRIGRLTGAGLFAESQRLGERADWRESGITGCDSVQNAMLGGRLFWLWGDTLVARYPLGLFHMPGAMTEALPWKSLEPPLEPVFDYFRDPEERVRNLAQMPGDGPTWLSGLITLPDALGGERMVAHFVKVRPPLTIYQTGLCVWQPESGRFELLRTLWTRENDGDTPPAAPEGHASLWTAPNGVEWVLFGNPLVTLRCPANFEAWQNPDTWEVIQPQEKLARAGGDKPVIPHTGCIAWSGFRQRWVTVFLEKFGEPSVFGELWYAEAESPLGPWGPAVKVVTHDNYTFYNPRLHPEFTAVDSPHLYFEGTFTAEFARHPPPSPRHNYNQILYRLDLDDPALAPAQTPPP
jgi:hypothetical protein